MAQDGNNLIWIDMEMSGLDPEIEVRPVATQVDDLVAEIRERLEAMGVAYLCAPVSGNAKVGKAGFDMDAVGPGAERGIGLAGDERRHAPFRRHRHDDLGEALQGITTVCATASAASCSAGSTRSSKVVRLSMRWARTSRFWTSAG